MSTRLVEAVRCMGRLQAPSVVLGVAAAIAAAVMTAGWQLATRHGVTTTLGPLDLALLRYGGPALMLLPLWRGLLPRARHSSWKAVGLTVLTGGLPFGLLISAGAQWAPASHVAVFTNGMVPILAACLAWLSTRERIGARRAVGFLLVLAGAAILAACGQAGIEGSWRGDLLFAAAAFCWAVHTHAYRRTGLTPWEGAAVVSSGSAIALFVLLLFPGTGPLMLFTAPWREVLLQILWQTVLGGLLAVVAYLAAVRHLGGARAALWTALVPALTVGGEVLFLSQPPQVDSMLAAALVAAGVLAGNLEARVDRG